MKKALDMRRALEEEGAFFHPAIDVLPIAGMGGGHGIVASEDLLPKTVLVTVPRSSMITAGKARDHLLFWMEERRFLHDPLCSNGVTKRRPLSDILDNLKVLLSPGSTIISSLLIAAEQCGRFRRGEDRGASDSCFGSFSDASDVRGRGGGPLFAHPWMKTWLLSLPNEYANLLELRDDIVTNYATSCGDGTGVSDHKQKEFYLHSFLCFDRHRKKVIEEQTLLEEEFNLVLSILSGNHPIFSLGCEGASRRDPLFTLREFIWAYNTLMTRGFSYDPEVWAVMPWVDYFNHSLDNNATMMFDEGREVYIFMTKAPVSKGEQIFLQYGSYTDAELLMWYGFTMASSLLPKFCDGGNPSSRVNLLRAALKRCLGESCVGSSHFCEHHTLFESLNTVLGHCFSPWARADGSYPRLEVGGSWLEALLLAYGKIVDGISFFRNSKECRDAFLAAEELYNIIIQRKIVSVPQHLVSGRCVIGAWGPSDSMLQLLMHVSRCAQKFDASSRLSSVAALRGICWVEFVCNVPVCGSKSPLEALLNVFEPCVEPVCVATGTVERVTRQVSVDTAYLLYFLSVEATTTELLNYVSHNFI